MPLQPGSRIGPYKVLSAIGAGGMGEVYRARDPKLNRHVALKVLPDIFSLDPDRLTRFTREAQVLAALNHPHIAAIYGFEDSLARRHSSSSWSRVRRWQTAQRLSIRNANLVPQDFSVARDKIVFNQGEITGNIWMTEMR